MEKATVNLEKLQAQLMQELKPEQEKQKPVKQPRKEYDCFDCPYLKDVGRAYYCMFFRMMNCPKGYGVPSIWEFYKTGRNPKETRAEEEAKSLIVIRPPFPDPIPHETKIKTTKQALTTLYHREIYEWHYEQGMSFQEIAEHLGCGTSYIRSYVSSVNKYWNWSYDDVSYQKQEDNNND